MIKTFAFRLHGAFGPYVAPGFGRTVKEARVNMARQMGKDWETWHPEVVGEFDSLEEYYAEEDKGTFASV